MGYGVNMSVRKVKDFQMPRSTIKVLKVLEVGLFLCTVAYLLSNCKLCMYTHVHIAEPRLTSFAV